MLDELARVAISGSLLRIATDHPDYALVIRECLDLHPAFATVPLDDKDQFWNLPGLDSHSEQGVTDFEIDFPTDSGSTDSGSTGSGSTVFGTTPSNSKLAPAQFA